MTPPIVRVTWTDSGLSFAPTWHTEDEVVEQAKTHDAICDAAGYLIYQDVEGITIGVTRDRSHNAWASVFWVAREAIIDMEYLTDSAP